MEFNLKTAGIATLVAGAAAGVGYGIYRLSRSEKPTTIKPVEKAAPTQSAAPATNATDKATAYEQNTIPQAQAIGAFMLLYRTASKDIDYDPKWANGTGYFDNACTMVELKPGESARSKDDNGRLIYLVGTNNGTIVIFKRYSEETDLKLCSNSPKRSIVDLEVKSPVNFQDLCGVLAYVYARTPE